MPIRDPHLCADAKLAGPPLSLASLLDLANLSRQGIAETANLNRFTPHRAGYVTGIDELSEVVYARAEALVIGPGAERCAEIKIYAQRLFLDSTCRKF